MVATKQGMLHDSQEHAVHFHCFPHQETLRTKCVPSKTQGTTQIIMKIVNFFASRTFKSKHKFCLKEVSLLTAAFVGLVMDVCLTCFSSV